MIVLIDNYDSFTFNLFHYLGRVGGGRCRASQRQDFRRRRDGARSRTRSCCHPAHARRTRPAFASISSKKPAPTIPILGVCLGHQAIGQAFGGKVVRATPIHGKVSEIKHAGTGVFRGINGPLKATRYHSLVVERASMPRALDGQCGNRRSAGDGTHARELPVHGVQFHPESIASEHGHLMLTQLSRPCRRLERTSAGEAR